MVSAPSILLIMFLSCRLWVKEVLTLDFSLLPAGFGTGLQKGNLDGKIPTLVWSWAWQKARAEQSASGAGHTKAVSPTVCLGRACSNRVWSHALYWEETLTVLVPVPGFLLVALDSLFFCTLFPNSNFPSPCLCCSTPLCWWMSSCLHPVQWAQLIRRPENYWILI